MVRFSRVLAAWAALCLPAAAHAQAPQPYPPATYSHGEPTGAEQETLVLINRARRDPVAESYRLAQKADWRILGSYYGWTREAFLAEFRGLPGNGHAAFAYPPQPPLAFNPLLIDAARRQNDEQASFILRNQSFGHYSGDGLASFDYAHQAGYAGADGENLAVSDTLPGETAVTSAENSLLFEVANIHRGGLGHRIQLLSADDSEVGLALRDDLNADRTLNHESRTDCFGDPSLNSNGIPLLYITGVVFSDDNLDGHYTAGEGLAGVLVQPDHGYWSAVTSASGGYAIPLNAIADAPRNTAPGQPLPAGDVVTLTFSGGPLREPIIRTVVLPGHSVEVNVAQPQPDGVPGWKRPALSAAFIPETGVVAQPGDDGTLQTTLQGSLRLTNAGRKNTGTFRVVLLLTAPGSDGSDLTGAAPLAEIDVANVAKKGGVLDVPLAYPGAADVSGRTVVALVDVLETVWQTEREGLRPTLTLP